MSMPRTRWLRPRRHGTPPRVEWLEARTLFHARTGLVDGMIEVAGAHGDNYIVMRWDPAARVIDVLRNEVSQLRVPDSPTRWVNLRGFVRDDVVLLDARLRLEVQYYPASGGRVIQFDVKGNGDGDRYHVVRAGCETEPASCGRVASLSGEQEIRSQADAILVRALAGIHAGHSGMSSGTTGDNRASGPAGGLMMGSLIHLAGIVMSPLHVGSSGSSPADMAPRDYMSAAKLKWMPAG